MKKIYKKLNKETGKFEIVSPEIFYNVSTKKAKNLDTALTNKIKNFRKNVQEQKN